MAMTWNISVSLEPEGVYLAQVLNRGDDPYYAQGNTYEEAISNLFGVIQMLQADKQESLKTENDSWSFQVPVPS